MKQSHWLLCVARNCDWSKKITPLSNLIQMASRGMQSLQMLKKMLEKSSQFEYCRSGKNTLGKLAVAVNAGGLLIRLLNERSVSDGGNLCPLWLVILRLV